MKCLSIVIVFSILFLNTFAQDRNSPVEVTPAIEKKINQEIAQEEQALKTSLKKEQTSAIIIEFQLDTFRIEKFIDKYISYDWSTAGMRTATYDAATKYDSLLNKYYKKLLLVLKPADRPALVNAQKAWINFRDKELKLIDVVGKDEYSGGGTIQQLTDSGEYLEIIRERVFTIYGHLVRATQAY